MGDVGRLLRRGGAAVVNRFRSGGGERRSAPGSRPGRGGSGLGGVARLIGIARWERARHDRLAGLLRSLLAERLQSIDISKHLSRRRTYPGFFPILHLDHIYYEGEVEVLKVTLPKDRMAKMASDHLPLVADLKIGFD